MSFGQAAESTTSVIDKYDELTIILSRHPDYHQYHFELRFSNGEMTDGVLDLPKNTIDVRQTLSSLSRGRHAVSVKRAYDTSGSVREMGNMLFEAIFRGRGGGYYRRAMQQAARQDSGLVFQFEIQDEMLAELPWEYLHDDKDFLSLSTRVEIVRKPARPRPWGDLVTAPKLRILAIAADVNGYMNLDQELALLRDISEKSSGLELTVVDDATPLVFEEALRGSDHDVLLLLGTGVEDSRGRQSWVLMNEDSSRSSYPVEPGQLVGERQLKALLSDNEQLRLVHFSGCHTQKIAAALAEDVPTAIGMRDTVSADACITFSEGLYRSLMMGCPLAFAMTKGRQMIDARFPGNQEWGLPMLFAGAAEVVLYRQTQEVLVASQSWTSRSIAMPTAIAKGDKRKWEKLQTRMTIYESNLARLNTQKKVISEGSMSKLIDQQIQDTEQELLGVQERMQILSEE